MSDDKELEEKIKEISAATKKDDIVKSLRELKTKVEEIPQHSREKKSANQHASRRLDAVLTAQLKKYDSEREEAIQLLQSFMQKKKGLFEDAKSFDAKKQLVLTALEDLSDPKKPFTDKQVKNRLGKLITDNNKKSKDLHEAVSSHMEIRELTMLSKELDKKISQSREYIKSLRKS